MRLVMPRARNSLAERLDVGEVFDFVGYPSFVVEQDDARVVSSNPLDSYVDDCSNGVLEVARGKQPVRYLIDPFERLNAGVLHAYTIPTSLAAEEVYLHLKPVYTSIVR